MSFTVRMLFEGVFAAVPDKEIEFGKPQAATSVELFFPSLRKPRDSGKDVKGGVLRHPHLLWVEVETRHLDLPKTSRKITRFIRPDAEKPERALFLLGPVEGAMPEALSLEIQGPARPLTINQAQPSHHYSPIGLPPVERQSLWWILRPAALTGNNLHGHFSPRETDFVVATCQLSTGHLSVPSFSNKEKSWNFKAYPSAGSGDETQGRSERAIANQLALDIETSTFSLTTKNKGGDMATISLLPPMNQEVVTIQVRNVEPETLLGVEIASDGPDPDFAENYRYSKGFDQYPWVLPVVSANVGAHERPCAPALFRAKI